MVHGKQHDEMKIEITIIFIPLQYPSSLSQKNEKNGDRNIVNGDFYEPPSVVIPKKAT